MCVCSYFIRVGENFVAKSVIGSSCSFVVHANFYVGLS